MIESRMRPWITIREAAHLAGVTPRTIWRWTHTLNLERRHRGRETTIPSAAIRTHITGRHADPR